MSIRQVLCRLGFHSGAWEPIGEPVPTEVPGQALQRVVYRCAHCPSAESGPIEKVHHHDFIQSGWLDVAPRGGINGVWVNGWSCVHCREHSATRGQA